MVLNGTSAFNYNGPGDGLIWGQGEPSLHHHSLVSTEEHGQNKGNKQRKSGQKNGVLLNGIAVQLLLRRKKAIFM